MLYIDSELPPLTRTDDDVILIGKTRVTLDTVIGSFNAGASAEEIAQQYPSVTLAEVYGAIAYYLAHQSEVDAYLQSAAETANIIQSENEARFDPNGVRARLLARRTQL